MYVRSRQPWEVLDHVSLQGTGAHTVWTEDPFPPSKAMEDPKDVRHVLSFFILLEIGS